MHQQLEALLRRLGEAEAGVEDPFADAHGVGQFGKALEIGVHRSDDIPAVVAEGVHRRRRSSHVHGYIRQTQCGNGREHVCVQLPQGNVVDKHRPHGIENPPDDAAPERVHGQPRQQLRRLLPQGFQGGGEAVPLFRFGHGLRARPGRAGAEIEEGGPFRGHLPAAPEKESAVQPSVRPEHAARRIERIAGQVDDSHDADRLFHRKGKDDIFFRKNREKCLSLFT